MGSKTKTNLIFFFTISDNLLSKYLLSIRISLFIFIAICKIKQWSGTSVWYLSSAYVFHEKFRDTILHQLTKFQYHTLFTSKDTHFLFLNSSLDIRYRQILQDLYLINYYYKFSNDLLGKKRGRGTYKNQNISRMKGAFSVK